MSVTTTEPTRARPGAPPGDPGPGGQPKGFFSGRLRRTRDDTPTEMMEFYSPSTALATVPAKPAANRTIWLIGSMVLIVFILFGVMKIDRIVTAGGKVIAMTPEIVVQPLQTGIVKTIAVSVGDIVRKGQLLAQLDPTFAAADNTAALDQVDRYSTEIDRLNAENRQVAYRPHQLTAGALVQEGIFAQRASAREAELRYYKGQIDAQRALMAQADADVRQYAKETGVAVDVEKMREQLEHDQVGSRLDTLTAVNARLEAERQVLASVQQSENARQTIAALQGQLDNYNQQWFADVSQTITTDAVQLATYRDQLEHAALNYKLIDLRAEQDSTVLSVASLSVGSVLQAGQTFFTLVPLNTPMEIDAQVTGDISGFMLVGQPVEILFSSFPSITFGMAHGFVRLISADSYLTGTNSPTGTGANSAGGTSDAVFTGQAPNSPYFYDTRITLDRLGLKNVPKDMRIMPGMPVTANIKVGERTIWSYLIEKVLPILQQGAREPN